MIDRTCELSNHSSQAVKVSMTVHRRYPALCMTVFQRLCWSPGLIFDLLTAGPSVVEAANRTAGASAVTGGSQTHVFPALHMATARRPRVNWSLGKGSQRLSVERLHCWLAARSIIQKQYLRCMLLLMYVHMGSRPLKPWIAIAWSCLTHFMQGHCALLPHFHIL